MTETSPNSSTTQAAIDPQGFVSGLVDFENAGRLKQAGEALIAKAESDLTFDLAGIQAANSVTVALLAGWLRCARLREIAISFTGVPDKLMAIIVVCGLDKVLPINNA